MNVDERLARAIEMVKEYEKIHSRLETTRNMISRERNRYTELQKQMAIEGRDVERLDGITLQNLWHSLMGTKELAKRKEQEEYLAARMKFDAAAVSLQMLESDLDRLEQQLIAMGDPELAAIGRGVQTLLGQLDATEGVVEVGAGKLVVVPRDVDHARAFASLAQDLLDHVVVRLRPVPGATQLPAVDDVAHEIEGVALDAAQEVEEGVCLAARRSQVHIRDPDGPDAVAPVGECGGRRTRKPHGTSVQAGGGEVSQQRGVDPGAHASHGGRRL